jgi:hypothetical protein
VRAAAAEETAARHQAGLRKQFAISGQGTHFASGGLIACRDRCNDQLVLPENSVGGRNFLPHCRFVLFLQKPSD